MIIVNTGVKISEYTARNCRIKSVMISKHVDTFCCLFFKILYIYILLTYKIMKLLLCFCLLRLILLKNIKIISINYAKNIKKILSNEIYAEILSLFYHFNQKDNEK